MYLIRLVRGALLFAAALAAVPSLAGMSPQQLQSRHRALLGGTAVEPGPGGALAAQAGERPSTAPALVDDAVSGGPGLAVSYTLIDRQSTPSGIELRLGAVANEGADRLRLVGSSLSVPAGPGELYASYEARHWGPGWFGSLILDAAAAPIAAAGWRRNEAGAVWQADLFAGTLRGHTDPSDPRLIGMRLEWRPTRAWTVGAARALQWGGEGRNEGLRSFFNALIGRDHSNDAALGDEPGNQLASLDVRYDLTLQGASGLGGYIQVGAEDKGAIVPTRRFWLAGADAGTRLGALSLRAIVELTDTTAGKADGITYRHHLFAAGYTHRGQPLGHPIGGDARLASAALLLDRGPAFAMLALHRGRAQPGAQRFVAGDELRGADLTLTFTVSGRATLGVSAHRWRAGAGADAERWAKLWAQYSWP